TYLSLIDSSLSVAFLLLLPWRLRQLSKQPIRVESGGWRGISKLISSVSLLCLQVIAAFLSASGNTHANPFLVAAAPVAVFGLVWLSRVEHKRSERPSDLVLLYLLSSSSCDLVQLTAPSLRSSGGQERLGLAIQFAAKLIVLGTESLAKEADLLPEWPDLPPEESAGIFGRSVLWWINAVLVRGYNNNLINHELPAIDRSLSSEILREQILRIWTQRDSPWLPAVLVRCLLQPMILVAAWRVFMIIFRYGQPLLITYSIAYIKSPDASEDEGYFVVLAAIIVYAGLAFSIRAYRQGLSALRVMIRGALVGLLHEHSLLAPSEGYDNSKVVALVTTDVEALEDAVETFYITWACVIEVIIGTVMLAKQVGWIWPVPHLIIILSSRTSKYVARNLKHRQTKWNSATRKRISVTAAMLASIKSIKMLGMQNHVEGQILDIRQDETEKAGHVRWIRVLYNVSANAVGLFTPVITIILFAIVAKLNGTALDPETAFPTIAVLSLVTNASNMVMTIIPKAVAAFPSFERIQSYLQPDEHGNHVQKAVADSSGVTPAILVKDLDVSWNGHKKVLSGINLEVPKGMIVACSGPVGSGKTTLARTILNEFLPITAGTVTVSTKRIAYCAQTPWLMNQTIKQVICGPVMRVTMDEVWYNTVIRACCLDEDLAVLPDGDETVVGDGGASLSGGQRQRVALARAVFQRCEIAVLDDTFSALDGRAEKQVAENLFGFDGSFRKLGTTVFWITSSTQHFDLVNHVIVLDDGRIQEQGPWSQLKAKGQQISKLIHENDSVAETDEGKTPVVIKAETQKSAAITPKDASRGDGDFSLYGYYVTNAGIGNVSFLVTLTALFGFFSTFPQYWMKWWTEDTGKHTAFFATGYALLNVAAWTVTSAQMWTTLLRVAPTSSLSLHKRLLETIMRAPLLFFSTTDTGVILNHFSQDISLVDKFLASAFQSLSVQIFKLLVQITVIFAVQPMVALTLPICGVVVFAVQKIYLRTSRQMRIIELESQSAVFSNLLETVRGVETIRAFGWQHEMAAENMHVVDISQRPFYLLFCLQRWLGLVLNLMSGGIAVTIILISVSLKGTTTGAQVGVALNVILVTKNTVLSLVNFWTELEISLGAVARLKTVDRVTPQEGDEPDDGQLSSVDEDWPVAGGLELRNVSASYNQNSLALRNISLKIAPGQTVAICGRTGSGKSSLLLSLLRLLDIESGGAILVDGVDITHDVSRTIVRERCFVTIAQDPFFLHDASLRFNLDPSASLSNQGLVSILERVGLWSHLMMGVAAKNSSTNNPQGEATVTSDQSRENDNDSLTTPLLDAASANRPLGYDKDAANAVLNKQFSFLPALSGGQAQLLALARGISQCWRQSKKPTVVQQPYPEENDNNLGGGGPKPIVLLDEVTSSLDAVTEATVCDIVEDEFVKNGHTVIMVTHKLEAYVAARKRTTTDAMGQQHGTGLTVVWLKGGRVESVEEEHGN
ncbi:hypothetical protein B0H66DRAFT_610708, partial [Apodospora peruviana]